LTPLVSDANCRICEAASAKLQGAVEYIASYAWNVHDCTACGCRFTQHDDQVSELLHVTGAISYYSDYRKLSRACQTLFQRGDLEGLRERLRAESKYRFVIDRVSTASPAANILEFGSSRGYLTSYFLLQGRPIIGVDISRHAVDSARALYGDHFCIAGDPAIKRRGPYDIIYHVGMIGCVANPVGLTRQLLALLRPGGTLIFNAPNRDALHLKGQLWLDTAPPPDVVTLFPPGFWRQQLSDVAHVVEEIEMVAHRQALTISLRRLFRHRWMKPQAGPMRSDDKRDHSWSQHKSLTWQLFERGVARAARATALARVAPQRPADFGLFVSMVRK
jgi:SAM-dependent methyltransferase